MGSSMSESGNIQTRAELFEFLQSQMQRVYGELRTQQRLEYESSQIKSYLLEVDIPDNLQKDNRSNKTLADFVGAIMGVRQAESAKINVKEKDEPGFFEVSYDYGGKHARVYIDANTNFRFWEVFSISKSRNLDAWLKKVINEKSEVDFVWLWPKFLEEIQQRGKPRGFGLDYDTRIFEGNEDEATTYLKMQIWGGPETDELYQSLKNSNQFKNKIVLAKIRMKEYSNGNTDSEFALQDLKYSGKCTTRGTSFSTHARTLSIIRSNYEKVISEIEQKYAIRWVDVGKGELRIEGFAIHFIPCDFTLPVQKFCERVFEGTLPFRLMGFVEYHGDNCAVVDAVDLHSGGKVSFEVYPDIISLYLPEGTCGNSVARFYTNLQRSFNVNFQVETDDGRALF
ncbi:MAG: hypothetical protein WAK60_00715 [Sedimentisphaerales bacterium]